MRTIFWFKYKMDKIKIHILFLSHILYRKINHVNECNKFIIF